MDIDEVYKEVVGEFGSQQKKIFFAVASLQIFAGCHMVHNVFVGAVPRFYCDTGNKSFEGCPNGSNNTGNVTCQKYNFSDNFTSVVSEWDLVCDNGYKVSLIQSIFMVGVLFGVVGFGNMADRYGRRFALAVTVGAFFIFSLASSFAPGYIIYVVLRFLTGAFCGGTILVSFVLMAEVVGAPYRGLCGMISPGIFALGIMFFSLLAYLIRTWRLLSIASSFYGPIGLSFFCFLPESPRWLLGQGRSQDAEQVLDMLAAKNTGTAQEPIKLRPAPLSTIAKTSGLKDLLTNSILRKRTVIQVYAWFVCSACYYGLTMSAGELGSNQYMSVALSALVEIPAYFLSFAFINRIGRNYTLCASFLIGGAACLLILAIPLGQTTAITSLALLGKLSLAASFAIVTLYSAELYPTVIRSNGMSMCSMSARVGGIVSPVIIPLGNVYPYLQFVVFGALGFTAGLFSFLLPETLGKHMPETIADLDKDLTIQGDPSSDLDEDRVRLLEDDISRNEREIDED